MYLQTLFTGSQEDHEVIPIYIYLCDFAKSCLLSFRLNTGIARVQASVVGKCQLRAQAQTYPWVGGFLVLCENQGGRERRFCHFD